MRQYMTALAAAVFMVAVPGVGPLVAETAGPQGPEQGLFRNQSCLVPSPEPSLLMHTAVFRPQGPGPFPLVVINHGSTQNEARRANYPLPAWDFEDISLWFVARGYAVVIPQRPGHGDTGGPYLENQNGCDNADYRRS